jgi:hypothetical protein
MYTDRQRKLWLLSNYPEIDYDGVNYTVVTWICQGDIGNQNDWGGLYLARGQTLDECIDAFLDGDIAEVDD